MTLSALLLALCLPTVGEAGEKLPLDRATVYDLTARGLAERLVDEQEEAGDPRGGTGGEPTSAYDLGWINKDLYFPARTVIDLGRPHDLTGAAWFDGAGDGPFEIRLFDPAAKEDANHGWRTLLTDDLKQYQAWSTGDLAGRARYVMIVVGSPAGSVAEVVLYGRPAEDADESPATERSPRSEPGSLLKPVAFDRFLGVNGFIDDPVERLAPVAGTVREYHSWQWDVLKEGPREESLAFSPSAVRGGNWAWDFDDYYRRLNAAGSQPAPVIQGTAEAAFELGGSTPPPHGQEKPVPAGRDAEAPASYREHAAHLYQFAARYGERTVPPSALRTEDGQQRSGLGLVNCVENWNEPNRTWEGRAAYFSPWELAAMTSADYDGHLGTLGPGHGVKTADPAFQLVLGGLVALDLESLRSIKLWCDLYRDGSFPADAVAVHYYCRKLDESGREAGVGLPPEQDELRRRVAAVTAWRDAHLPGVEVHLGEFGYDTHPASPMHALAIGALSAEQVQGYWLVRSALELSAAGLDRAQIFMLRDVDSDSPGKFSTCGLTGTKEDGHPPKPSWFHVAAARAALAGLHYDGDLEDDRVRGVWFAGRNASGEERRALAVWSPTAEDRRIPDWAPPGPPPTSLIRLSDDDPAGIREPWAGALTVTEAPAFLQW